jgi:DNA-binding transcriptional LysR family regulator
MRAINLRSIDLNLLPVLNVLLEEKSVTVASRRVHLSQSATSSALRRLRETFNDPILVRRGQHMVASQRAMLIQAELKEALEKLSGVVGTMRYAETPEENINVRLSAPEHVSMTMSSTIRRLLDSGEHHLNINLLPFSRRTILEQLEDGSVDIAIGAFGRLRPNIRRQCLYHESPVMVMRAGHPAWEGRTDDFMSIEDFTKYPHLQVTAGEILEDAWISRMLSARSVARQVTAVLANVSLVPQVLNNTDLLCVGTRRGLEYTPQAKGELVWLRLPPSLDISDYDIEMIWHDRTNEDPDLEWVREQIVAGGEYVDVV